LKARDYKLHLLDFMRANKLPIYQVKPSMYVFCAFPKEGMVDTIDALDPHFGM